jgi:hypothetical protein
MYLHIISTFVYFNVVKNNLDKQVATQYCRECEFGYCNDDFKQVHAEGDFRRHVYVTLDKGTKGCSECEEKVGSFHCIQVSWELEFA